MCDEILFFPEQMCCQTQVFLRGVKIAARCKRYLCYACLLALVSELLYQLCRAIIAHYLLKKLQIGFQFRIGIHDPRQIKRNNDALIENSL